MKKTVVSLCFLFAFFFIGHASYTVNAASETESNDYFTEATLIPINTQTTGTLDFENDDYIDFYKIFLPNQGVFTLKFNNPFYNAGDSGRISYYIEICNENNEAISAKALPEKEKTPKFQLDCLRDIIISISVKERIIQHQKSILLLRNLLLRTGGKAN